MAKENKPRWKDLPFYDRFARELKRDGAEKVLLEIEEGVAEPEENCPNRINLMPAYHPSEIFSQVYESY